MNIVGALPLGWRAQGVWLSTPREHRINDKTLATGLWARKVAGKEGMGGKVMQTLYPLAHCSHLSPLSNLTVPAGLIPVASIVKTRLPLC